MSTLVLSAFQPHLVSRPGLKEASLFWSMNWSKTLFQSACSVGFTDDGPLVGSQLGRAAEHQRGEERGKRAHGGDSAGSEHRSTGQGLHSGSRRPQNADGQVYW
jgi:hypothetical protein